MAPALGLGGLLLVVWRFLTPVPVGELVFPSPESVRLSLSMLGWDLLRHAGVTFARVALGWTLGVPLGIGLGLAMAWSQAIRLLVHPLIEAVRPLPPVALIPFFIIWFGIGISGQVFLIALGCFMVLTVNTFTAVQTVPPVYVRAAIALGAPQPALYRTIILPAILPSLVGGFRIAAALAFGLGIAAEFMGAQSGIGFLMMVARRTLNTNTILVGVIVIGIESYLLDLAIRAAGRYLCRWTESPIDVLRRSAAIVA